MTTTRQRVHEDAAGTSGGSSRRSSRARPVQGPRCALRRPLRRKTTASASVNDAREQTLWCFVSVCHSTHQPSPYPCCCCCHRRAWFRPKCAPLRCSARRAHRSWLWRLCASSGWWGYQSDRKALLTTRCVMSSLLHGGGERVVVARVTTSHRRRASDKRVSLLNAADTSRENESVSTPAAKANQER